LKAKVDTELGARSERVYGRKGEEVVDEARRRRLESDEWC